VSDVLPVTPDFAHWVVMTLHAKGFDFSASPYWCRNALQRFFTIFKPVTIDFFVNDCKLSLYGNVCMSYASCLRYDPYRPDNAMDACHEALTYIKHNATWYTSSCRKSNHPNWQSFVFPPNRSNMMFYLGVKYDTHSDQRKRHRYKPKRTNYVRSYLLQDIDQVYANLRYVLERGYYDPSSDKSISNDGTTFRQRVLNCLADGVKRSLLLRLVDRR
jgi:hypothetical protein